MIHSLLLLISWYSLHSFRLPHHLSFSYQFKSRLVFAKPDFKPASLRLASLYYPLWIGIRARFFASLNCCVNRTWIWMLILPSGPKFHLGLSLVSCSDINFMLITFTSVLFSPHLTSVPSGEAQFPADLEEGHPSP